MNPGAPENTARNKCKYPYPKPTQVSFAEQAKVFRRIQFREFGKLAVYLRYKPCLVRDD